MVNPFAGVKLWAMLAVVAAAGVAGGIAGMNIGAWRAQAGFVADFKQCADTAMARESGLRDAVQRAEQASRDAAERVAADNQITEQRQLALLQRVEESRRETRKLADAVRELPVGGCSFTGDADRVRAEAWERHRTGVPDDPAAAGQAGGSDAGGDDSAADPAGGEARERAGGGGGR